MEGLSIGNNLYSHFVIQNQRHQELVRGVLGGTLVQSYENLSRF